MLSLRNTVGPNICMLIFSYTVEWFQTAIYEAITILAEMSKNPPDPPDGN